MLLLSLFLVLLWMGSSDNGIANCFVIFCVLKSCYRFVVSCGVLAMDVSKV